MTAALITLSVLLCASLMACAYLFADNRQLNRLVVRQDALLVKQDEQLTNWQNKALARNSMTPLGEEMEERTPSGLAAQSESYDLRPPIARMQEQWDREEDEQLRRNGGGLHAVPLPDTVRDGLLEAARKVAS